MAADRELIVRVIGDDRSLQQMFDRDQKAVKKFGTELEATGGRFSKLNQTLRGGLSGFGGKSSLLFGSGAFLGTAAITAGVKTSIDAASDLNEQITKSQQVFGDSSKAILDWSRTTATAIGTSQEQALEAAGTFGNLFRSIKLGTGESAKVSRELVQLAADLASFNNANPGDVLQDIRSGLVGEAEPLRKYGILLSETRVQQEALKETGKESVKQLTDQEKTLARINIIFRDTTTAQGDFARTSDGLANQQRILSAEVQDLEANLGKLLLPSVKLVVGSLNDATTAANNLVGGLQGLGSVKIPTIHIPFAFDVGGGGSRLGDFFKNALIGGAENLPNVGPLIRGLVILAAARVKEEAEGQTPALAAKFRESLGGFFQDALDQAVKTTPAPKVKGVPGFATGLTPEDILGPLVKDIPKRLQEQLLDVEIASPDNAQALIKVLEKQKNTLLEALDDPRLTRDDRIGLKQKLKGVEGAIDGQNAAIKAAADAATQKRQDAIDDATQKAEQAKQRISDKFGRMIEALQLGIDKASLTKTLNDDLSSLLALKAGLEKQIKAGVDVANAESQLVQVTANIAAKREEIRQKAAEAAQARQFRALGLSAGGDEIVPGAKNLSQRISSLLSKIGTGDLKVSSKVADRLKAAQKLIRTEGDKLTKSTREKINEFIKAANGDDSTTKLSGPLTKNSVFQANKILEGLGLNDKTEALIRQRVNAFNNADAFKTFKTPTTSTVRGFGAPFVVENHNTIVLDGDVVGRSVTKSQQKRRTRNPVQKRGPNRNF